jgi:hypothetical protein
MFRYLKKKLLETSVVTYVAAYCMQMVELSTRGAEPLFWDNRILYSLFPLHRNTKYPPPPLFFQNKGSLIILFETEELGSLFFLLLCLHLRQ